MHRIIQTGVQIILRYSYPEHVIDEVHQAPEEKWGAIHCIFLHCFVRESVNKNKRVIRSITSVCQTMYGSPYNSCRIL